MLAPGSISRLNDLLLLRDRAPPTMQRPDPAQASPEATAHLPLTEGSVFLKGLFLKESEWSASCLE